MVAGEVRRPQRNLMLALVGGTLIVIAVYLVTNVAYFYVLPGSEVAASDRVAAEMMRRVLGDGGASAVSIAAMISIFAALNGSILSGARVPYALARDGCFFRALASVHPKFQTPGAAILAMSGWASLLALSGRYEQLFTYVIFASWLFYGMTAAAVIVLRIKRPELARPYRTPGYPWVPGAFVLAALALTTSTLIDAPRESLFGLVLVFAGLPFYFYWKRRKSG
jgi:APA family basic amino acid/polyamine antiporter